MHTYVLVEPRLFRDSCSRHSAGAHTCVCRSQAALNYGTMQYRRFGRATKVQPRLALDRLALDRLALS